LMTSYKIILIFSLITPCRARPIINASETCGNRQVIVLSIIM
jgi:hypothetical protein